MIADDFPYTHSSMKRPARLQDCLRFDLYQYILSDLIL